MALFREFRGNLSFIPLNEGRKPSDYNYHYQPYQGHTRSFYLLSWPPSLKWLHPRPAFLKLWSADHKWSSGSALVVLLD